MFFNDSSPGFPEIFQSFPFDIGGDFTHFQFAQIIFVLFSLSIKHEKGTTTGVVLLHKKQVSKEPILNDIF